MKRDPDPVSATEVEVTARLAEATALLVRIRQTLHARATVAIWIDAFLSRAPAPAAEPGVIDLGEALRRSLREKAPAADHKLRGTRACDECFLAGFTACELGEPKSPARRRESKAEATLAAVRAELDAPGVGCLSSLVDRIRDLLRAKEGT